MRDGYLFCEAYDFYDLIWQIILRYYSFTCLVASLCQTTYTVQETEETEVSYAAAEYRKAESTDQYR